MEITEEITMGDMLEDDNCECPFTIRDVLCWLPSPIGESLK